MKREIPRHNGKGLVYRLGNLDQAYYTFFAGCLMAKIRLNALNMPNQSAIAKRMQITIKEDPLTALQQLAALDKDDPLHGCFTAVAKSISPTATDCELWQTAADRVLRANIQESPIGEFACDYRFHDTPHVVLALKSHQIRAQGVFGTGLVKYFPRFATHTTDEFGRRMGADTKTLLERIERGQMPGMELYQPWKPHPKVTPCHIVIVDLEEFAQGLGLSASASDIDLACKYLRFRNIPSYVRKSLSRTSLLGGTR